MIEREDVRADGLSLQSYPAAMSAKKPSDFMTYRYSCPYHRGNSRDEILLIELPHRIND